MKKFSLLALAIATAFCASAQANILKEAERAMKDGKDAKDVVNVITPALTNPETARLAKTWYIPGKASFNQYDKMLGQRQSDTSTSALKVGRRPWASSLSAAMIT